MSWLDRLFWPRMALSDVQRDVAVMRLLLINMDTRLKEIKTIMAADRELLAQLATDLTALSTPVSDLIASETALRARIAELEGAAAADETGDLAAAQAVKDAFDNLAGKFRDDDEAPDVQPLPEDGEANPPT